MNSMILVMALSVGQGPGGAAPVTPGSPFPAVRVQGTGGPPLVLPGLIPMAIPGQPGMPPMVVPMPPSTGNGTTPAAPGAPAAEEAPKADKQDEEKKPDTPEPPIYLLERSLKDTWLGKTMADHNLKLYGWSAMSYTLSTTSNSNLPVTFNDQPNKYQLNQNWIQFDKTIDPTKGEFQWGFATSTILPGTDARFTLARGLFDQQLREGRNGGPRDYPIDLYQAYFQAFLPNLGGNGTTVKVGRFSTHCGYELVQAVDTPFVSRSYLFQYNPFTHTGIWAVTQLNDTWSVGNGVALGSDNFIDSANRLTGLGQIKWAPPDGKTSVIFNTVVTRPRFDVAENFAFYNVYNLQVVHKCTDKLTYVVDAAFSHMDGVPNVGSATWYGAANYFIYKVTDKLTSTLRTELFHDTKGIRTGFKGLYTEVTYGVAWSPVPGVIIRPNIRFDHNNQSRAFEGDRSMLTGALEMIFRW